MPPYAPKCRAAYSFILRKSVSLKPYSSHIVRRTHTSTENTQRISIARCILKDAPIVILDEATAGIDADNESYIQAAISELVRGKTLLVVAHRLHTIAGADQILVIDDGKIAERGTHAELMSADGIYRNMVTKRAATSGFHN